MGWKPPCPFTNWLDCFLKTQMFWWVFAFDLPTVMTWVVVWFPICPFPINQSVVFYIEISREDPTPLWPIFPDRLASKSWGLSGVFFSPWFLNQKKHAGYSPSVQKHLPKILSTQSNPRKDPEWALRPSFPKLGRWSPPRGLLFWVEFDLGMDGNPWKPIIFPDFFGTTIHLPTMLTLDQGTSVKKVVWSQLVGFFVTVITMVIPSKFYHGND